MHSAILISVFSLVLAHSHDHSRTEFLDSHFGPLEGDQAVQLLAEHIRLPHPDYIDDLDPKLGPLYSGIVTFAHLPLTDCFSLWAIDERFDIAVLGAPFDTAVTYRPGARFGPAAIREGSRRISAGQQSAYKPDLDPYLDWARVVECGDVGMTPFDNRVALDQLYRAHRSILNHTVAFSDHEDGKRHYPRVLTLGGDHTTTFSALRALHEVYGPIAVLHFDSHIDTWDPIALGATTSKYSELNHGTFLHFAHEKGYLAENNMHVGSRAPYVRARADLENDQRCGFSIISTRELDTIGIDGVVGRIRDTIGDQKVYISVDIDVLDPAFAPGTGTSEPGGYSTREFLTILDALNFLNIVGADVVEVAPAYDTGDITSLAAAEIGHSLISLMVENKV